MDIRFNCNKCGQSLEIDEAGTGLTIQCPTCGQSLTVPAAPPKPVPATPPQWRAVRVFISSTFLDMREEREELVKRVFPQLRKLCEQRGVTWGEVDLRWGITDEQKAEGKVLPICLEEIKRCRPYFIGLLGERYGWVPEQIPQELLEREPWLRQHQELSVTELEIIHGVLREPDMHRHAYFYFRDPRYVETVPKERRNDFTTEGTEASEKRRRLKHRIRLARDEQVCRLRENYRDPQELGRWVLEDFTALINQLFPEDQQPDSLGRDALDHEAFAHSRARVYIGRQGYFDRLDAHAQGDGPPLVVLGESGSGKSALLANWALRLVARESRETHAKRSGQEDDKDRSVPSSQSVVNPFVLMHFIGATPYSSDWAAMLRRIMSEFKRRFGIEQEIPDKRDDLRSAFANWLHMASAACGRSSSPLAGDDQGEGVRRPAGSKWEAVSDRRPLKIILILDALNQLADRDGAPDLVWLPPAIPENVCLILSTLPGRPLDDLKKRDWPTLQVKALDPAERKQLITDYLAQYTKALSPARAETIAAATQSANPLYLRALLEELRVFGEHERLDERIAHYLSGTTVDGLYQKILERYEQDYERDRPGLVRNAMSALWAARRGLSETELLELLGTNGQPLPRAHWSPLFLAAEHALASRSGLIGFFHDYLRQAVQHRYLPTEPQQQASHLQLGAYFQSVDLGPRKIEELPWQLEQAKSWQGLVDLLKNPPFLAAACAANPHEVSGYWMQIEVQSPLRMLNAYQPVLSAWWKHQADEVEIVAEIVGDHNAETTQLWDYLASHYRKAGDRTKLAKALSNLSINVYQLGDVVRASKLNKELERICRETGDNFRLQDCLGSRAVMLHRAAGKLEAAMAVLKEQERLCRQLGNDRALGYSLGNQGSILYDRCDLDGAMKLFNEQERIGRATMDPFLLGEGLSNQAGILAARGNLVGALALLMDGERIFCQFGLRDALAQCLQRQADHHYDMRSFDDALALWEKAERLWRELGAKHELEQCLFNEAHLLFYTKNDPNGALPKCEEAIRIQTELREAPDLLRQAQTLLAQIKAEQAHELFYKKKDPHGALPKCEEVIRILKKTKLLPDLLRQAQTMLAQIKARLQPTEELQWRRLSGQPVKFDEERILARVRDVYGPSALPAMTKDLAPATLSRTPSTTTYPKAAGIKVGKILLAVSFLLGALFGFFFSRWGSHAVGDPFWLRASSGLFGAAVGSVICLAALGRTAKKSGVSKGLAGCLGMLVGITAGSYLGVRFCHFLFLPILGPILWSSFWGIIGALVSVVVVGMADEMKKK